MDPLQVSFLTSFVVFLLTVYSCSLSIHLLLNRFNVVVANGHDDIEMWTIGLANYPIIEIIEAAAEVTLQ